MKTRVLIFVALFLMLIAASVMAQDRRSRCSRSPVRVVIIQKNHRSLVHKRYHRCRTEYFLKYKMNKPTRSKATYGKKQKKYPKIRINKRSSRSTYRVVRRSR